MAADHGLQAFFAPRGVGSDCSGCVSQFSSGPEAAVERYRSVAMYELVE